MSDKAALSAKLETMQAVPGVRAIAPSHTQGDAAGTEAPVTLTVTDLMVDPGGARAFERAGWTFVRAGLNDGRAGGTKADHDVIYADGHLKILSHALNVKFRPSASQSTVKSILEEYGLALRRGLGFSPNLFLVEDFSGDSMSKAKSLNALDDVVYAEPVLIEPIAGR